MQEKYTALKALTSTGQFLIGVKLVIARWLTAVGTMVSGEADLPLTVFVPKSICGFGMKTQNRKTLPEQDGSRNKCNTNADVLGFSEKPKDVIHLFNNCGWIYLYSIDNKI